MDDKLEIKKPSTSGVMISVLLNSVSEMVLTEYWASDKLGSRYSSWFLNGGIKW